MNKNFYITTTLPYANAKPHIGFAMEIVRADVVARYQRLLGHDVFFNTGTDEHGTKILQKAQEEGKDVMEFLDEKAANFTELADRLNIKYDRFIRTTDKDHENAAQNFWKLCDQNGYIYKKKYAGLYCVGCEMFINEKDLINGECEHHPGKKLEEIEEENYFFKYSEFQKDLLEKYSHENSEKNDQNKNGFVIPSNRQKEISNFVESGLEDFSISRLKEKMPWGVPVPGDDEHVMYVWFDALVNYISTLGWGTNSEIDFSAPSNLESDLFKKFWNDATVVQYCGKDNLQFQAARWQLIQSRFWMNMVLMLCVTIWFENYILLKIQILL
jgi:methionyl-tRNA synthetase